jgi:hypothetical protein
VNGCVCRYVSCLDWFFSFLFTVKGEMGGRTGDGGMLLLYFVLTVVLVVFREII